MPARLLLALLLLVPAAARAQADRSETDSPLRPARYTPPSRMFTCDVPKGWSVFEEDEGSGAAVHMLGPENAEGTFRSGLDVRFMEKGSAGYLPYRKFVDLMRKENEETQRSATSIRTMRTGAGLARVFEISETRRLPPDRLPSLEEQLHRYVAIIPSGDNYYFISLASTRDTYLDFRDLWAEFLRTFYPH